MEEEKSGPRQNRFDETKISGAGPKRDPLDYLEGELQKEIDRWGEEGLSPDGIQHTNGALWYMQLQIQALVNLVLKKNMISQHEFDIEWKNLMLSDMRTIRTNSERARQEAIKVGDADIAVPNRLRLVDPKTGEEFKL